MHSGTSYQFAKFKRPRAWPVFGWVSRIDIFIIIFFKEIENLNRKTWARIPAQSKASFFPQKDFQIL